MSIHRKLITVAAVATLALGLAACGGGGGGDDDTAMMPEPPPPPMPHVCEAGPSQACVDARQAELDAVGDDGTVAQLNAARAALAAATMAWNEAQAAAAAAAARQALVDAAMCTAGTQACVDAHQALVDALDADESTTADDLATAQANLAAVQMAKNDADAAAAAAAARQALVDAATCTAGTQACVDAHQALVDALMADDSTSAAELAAAQAGLTAAQMALADATAAATRQAMVDAAMCTDGTVACVGSHDALIAVIRGELATLRADDTATQAQIRAKEAELQAAMDARAPAQMALDAANVAAARQALVDAAMCTDATEACVMAHQALVDALQADLDTLNADPDATNAEVEAAETALASATTARDGVQADINAANQLVEDTNTVQGLIDTAKASVDALTDESSEDAVTAARALVKAAQDALAERDNLSGDAGEDLRTAIAALDTSVGTQETRLANDAAAAKVVADTKAAGTKEMAISTEAAQTTDATIGGTDATIGTSDGNYEGPAISRDRDGTTITVTVHGATDADDVTFEKAEDLTSSSNPGQMLTRTHEADADDNVVTEVVIVYTDIEAPTATAFAMVAGQALDARDLDDTMDADGDGTNDNDFTALNVVTANIAQIMSAGFTAAGSGTLNYANDDATTDEMDEAFETAGTYNGAPGTYRCNGTSTCSVTYDAMGAITAVAGDWVFTPDAGAMSDVADANYLHYGAWLQRTADSDGVTTYNEVETFAGSSVAASGDSGIGELEGIAQYEGGAAGVYVHKTFNTDGTSNATSGHFTADASLTAYFSGGDTPANKADTLEGTIDSFVLQHGEENSWSVELQSDGDATTDGVQPDATPGTMDGTASGGVAGQDGSFTATFHGPAGDTDSSDTTPDVVPHTVVGEFNSVFSNGSVAGGFGARRQ